MIRITFTDNIQRHCACPPASVRGQTVRQVLDEVFEANPKARSYVLDDQGGLRRHMVVFVNGEAVRDRAKLTDPVADGAELFVMQALSGG